MSGGNGQSAKASFMLGIPYETAKNLADRIVESIRRSCLRVDVAGEIRRREPLIRRVDVVAVASHNVQQLPAVGPNGEATAVCKSVENLLATRIGRLVGDGRLIPEDIRGDLRRRYAIPAVPTLKLTLHLTTVHDYGARLAMATGPEPYVALIAKPAGQGGLLKPGLILRDFGLWNLERSRPVATPDEAAFFEHVITGWIPPEARTTAVRRSR